MDRWLSRSTLVAAPCLLFAMLATVANCNVFKSLPGCHADSDCALGDRCDSNGNFCTLDTGPIVVGVTLPLSGQLGSFGLQMKAMVDFAQTYINAQAALAGSEVIFGGRQIEFSVVDDQGDDTIAAEQVQAFISARVAAIIGPIISSQCELVEPLTGSAQMLEITPSAGATQLQTLQPSGTDRYFFQTITSIARGTAPTMAMYATCPTAATAEAPGRAACKRLAILRSDDVTGQDYATAITTYAEKRGANVVVTVTVPEAQMEVSAYAGAVASLFAPQPDCAALIVLPQVACNFFRAAMLTESPFPPSSFWIGYSGLDTSDFVTSCSVGTDLARGVSGGDDDFAPPRYQYTELLTAYNKATDAALATLPAYAPNVFDAAAVVALAIAQAGGVSDRVAIRNAVRTISDPTQPVYSPGTLANAFKAIRAHTGVKYTGASSDINFDPYGVVSEATVAWRIVGQQGDGGAPCEGGSCGASDSIAIVAHFPETLPDDIEAGKAECPDGL
jgi:ABC-type branched-subunit amino acid transport system substrate-binding protein